MELEAESRARTWTPVLQVPDETVAVATFQWKRVPLTRGVLLRLGVIAAAIVIVCGVLAFGVSEMLPKTYGARSEIVYPLTSLNPSGDTLRTDRILATQLVAIKSRQVLTPVARDFHMTADALSKKIVASVLQNSEVIRIEADDASQAKALAISTLTVQTNDGVRVEFSDCRLRDVFQLALVRQCVVVGRNIRIYHPALRPPARSRRECQQWNQAARDERGRQAERKYTAPAVCWREFHRTRRRQAAAAYGAVP